MKYWFDIDIPLWIYARQAPTLMIVSLHGANFVINGGTGYNNNLRWRQTWHHNDFQVIVSLHGANFVVTGGARWLS